MKKSFFILLLFSGIKVCIAQRVTYNDLKYVLYHNIGETEDFLSKKGFSFSGVDSLGAQKKALSYLFSKNSSHTNNYINVSKKVTNNISFEVSLFTLVQTDYLALKNEVKALGFKIGSSRTNNRGSLIIPYFNGYMEMEFVITREKDNEITDYYITLQDTHLEVRANDL